MNIKDLAKRAELRSHRIEKFLQYLNDNPQDKTILSGINLILAQLDDNEQIIKSLLQSSSLWHDMFITERCLHSSKQIKVGDPTNGEPYRSPNYSYHF
jgi:predicted aldo/keto reductase-like oxidoreductase